MRQPIHTKSAPAAAGPYSQAIQVGKEVYFAGQIGLDPQTGLLADGFAAQATQVFSNLQAVAEAAGGNLHEIVKLTIYVTDLVYFAALNDIMTQFFQAPYPARTTIQVSALPKAALVEMDAIMVLLNT